MENIFLFDRGRDFNQADNKNSLIKELSAAF
jgi:hypothetical protein